MTQASNLLPPQDIPLPRLSDHAAAEIYLFIEHILNLFEARYGTQISRFYESMSRDTSSSPTTIRGSTTRRFE